MLQLKALYSVEPCCEEHARLFVTLADQPNTSDMAKKVFEGLLNDSQIDEDFYSSTAKTFLQGVNKGLGGATFKADDYRNTLKAHLDHNVFAFSGAKSLAVMEQYNKLLQDDKGAPVTWDKFKSRVADTDAIVNEAYLNTEYRSAVGMSQMADKWDSLQSHSYLEYRTVGDSRVREEHRKLDKLVLERNDKLWAKIYPPNGWGCRCTVVPAAVSTTTPAKRDVAETYVQGGNIQPYFQRNVGVERVIFNNDHPYFTRLKSKPEGATRDVQFDAERNYAMPSVEKILASQDLPILNQAETKEQAAAQWDTVVGKGLELQAPDGLSLNIGPQLWQHSVDEQSHESRWRYINHMKDVFTDPDEAWSRREVNGDTGKVTIYKSYVKYYEDGPVVFSYEVGKPEGYTIYKADVDETGTYKGMKDNVRRGILTHRKI